MTLADQIRNYASIQYVQPARNKGKKQIEIRSGDIHDGLKLSNRYPSVCGALGSNIFIQQNNLEQINIRPPLNGANTIFVFKIL